MTSAAASWSRFPPIAGWEHRWIWFYGAEAPVVMFFDGSRWGHFYREDVLESAMTSKEIREAGAWFGPAIPLPEPPPPLVHDLGERHE